MLRDKKKDELAGKAKAELGEELDGHETPALGPVVPEGEDEAQEFERVGSITGVQPLEDKDIPEAGR